MRYRFLLALATACAGAVPLSLPANWPAWRGPSGDGTTAEARFPLHWSAKENVRWRVNLPDRGNSTPVVWDNHVFVTQAIDRTHQRLVLAFDRETGRQLWQAGTFGEPREETHQDNPYAAASPVTDGERVVVTFGSAGVWAFDFEGGILWTRSLGPQRHEWGYSSSPVLHGDRVYVYHGPGEGSKLVALNKRNGRVAWEVLLPEPVPTVRFDGFQGRLPGIIGTFSTPLVVPAGDHHELILAFPESVRAYAPETGRELWRDPGLNPLVYTSPVPVGDAVLAMGGFFGSSLLVRTGGHGDVSRTHRVWHEVRARKNRLGSAVVFDGRAYVFNMEGLMECLDVATGRQLWEERLKGPGPAGGSWSSPTLVGDRIYAVNKSGDTFVLRASPNFEVMATNSIAEPINASPAMSRGDIFLRTWEGLWCLTDRDGLAAR
ncbi:MAG: PQQ-binding-like beta-propeller repeat protein [Verrucomicrobiae bacterium]|nr:PQQ-binding-like beta-propeller repeat protein [Verrucomicrobiae bacterium]